MRRLSQQDRSAWIRAGELRCSGSLAGSVSLNRRRRTGDWLRQERLRLYVQAVAARRCKRKAGQRRQFPKRYRTEAAVAEGRTSAREKYGRAVYWVCDGRSGGVWRPAGGGANSECCTQR